MNPFDLYHTITTNLVLPMICEETANYNDITNNSFINAYIADYQLPEHDDNIIIVQEKPGELNCIKLKPKTEYKVNENYVYIYEIPEEYKKDYNLILNSDYSLTSKKYKNHLLNFWKEENNSSKLFYLLYKELYNYVSMEKLNVLRWKIPDIILSEEIYWRT